MSIYTPLNQQRENIATENRKYNIHTNDNYTFLVALKDELCVYILSNERGNGESLSI